MALHGHIQDARALAAIVCATVCAICVPYVRSYKAGPPHCSAMSGICECDKLLPQVWEASADFAVHDEARICFSGRFQVVLAKPGIFAEHEVFGMVGSTL